VGDSSYVNAADGISLSSTGTGSGILVGANGGSGATVQVNSGNIALTTDAGSTIEIGSGTYIDAVGSTGQGNVTFTVGTPPVATPVTVATGGNVIVNQIGTGTATTTTTGFNAAGSVVFNLEGANISLGNAGTSVDQITFDGNNTVTADPPAPGSVAPVLLNLLTSLPLVNAGGLSGTSAASISPATIPAIQIGATGAGLEHSTNLSSPEGFNSGSTALSPGGIIPGATISVATGERTTVFTNNALANGSVQTLIGTTSGATSISVSGASGSAQSELGSLNSFNSVNLTNAASNLQTAGVLQTNSARNTESLNKLLTGGVSSKGKHKDGDKYMVRELPQGALLIAPERSTVVPTPFGTVKVASKSVALIVSSKDGLSVYNLDETHRDSITISVNDETVSLEPGSHVTVTHDTNDRFEQVNPAQYIAYRNIRSRGMKGNLKAYHSEFNHLTAIAGLEPLREMIRSSDPAKRKIGEHMLKTSALLSVMNNSSAPYEKMDAPSVTAMK
jgi:hypothetical protein